MKKTFSLLMLNLVGVMVLAQSSQSGLVRQMNSGKKPLSGVQIVCIDASPSTSDQNGVFQLKFVRNKKPGDLIVFDEIRKAGYEVVNEMQLEVIKIGNASSLDVDIIMAPKGTVATAKAKYYETADQALSERYQQEKRKLTEALQKVQIDAEVYQTQNSILRNQFERQKKELDALAGKFARINFDDVSALYKEALQLFQEGKINEAINKLETFGPLAQLEDIKQKEKSLIELSLLQAEMYQVTLQNDKANESFEKLLVMFDADIKILNAAAAFYIKQSQIQKGIELYKKILVISTDHDNNARTLVHLGNSFLSIHDLVQAENAFQQALTKFRSTEKNDSIAHQAEIASTLNSIGTIHWQQLKWDTAEHELNRALTMFHNLNRVKKGYYLPHIAFTYNNLGRYYFEYAQFLTQKVGGRVMFPIVDTNPYIEKTIEKSIYSYEHFFDIFESLLKKGIDPYLTAELQDFFDLKVTIRIHGKSYRLLEEKINIAFEQLLSRSIKIYGKLAEKNSIKYLPFVALKLINRSELIHNQHPETDLQDALILITKICEQDSNAFYWLKAQTLIKISHYQTHEVSERSLLEALRIYQYLESISPNSFTNELITTHLELGSFYIGVEKSPEVFPHLKLALKLLSDQYKRSNEIFLEAQWMELSNLIIRHMSNSLYPDLKKEGMKLLSQYEHIAEKHYKPLLINSLLQSDYRANWGYRFDWLSISPHYIPAKTMEIHCEFFASSFKQVQTEYQKFKTQKDEQGRSVAQLCLEQLAELEKKGLKHADLAKLKAFLAK